MAEPFKHLLGARDVGAAAEHLATAFESTLPGEFGAACTRIEAALVVHHVKDNGGTSPKVFKGWSCTLGPREALVLRKRHSVRRITTRRYFSGAHCVELQVNGAIVSEATFDLRVDA